MDDKDVESNRKLDETTSSMDVVALNNMIVCFRKIVKESKVRVIHRLTNQKEKLKKRKGNEKVVAANERKAERLVEEIQRLKHIEADKITKFSLANTQTVEEAAKMGNLETKIMTRIACEKPMQDKVTSWREKHEDWRSLSAFILTKNTGRRYRKNRKAKTVQGEKDALAVATDSVRSMSKDGLGTGTDQISASDGDYSDQEEISDARQVAAMSDEDDMSELRLLTESSDEDDMSNIRQVANSSDDDEMSSTSLVGNLSDEDSPDQSDVSDSDDSAADDGVILKSDEESSDDITSSVSKLKEKLLSKSPLKERNKLKSTGKAVAKKANRVPVVSNLENASPKNTGSTTSQLKGIADIRMALLGEPAKDTPKKSAPSKDVTKEKTLNKVKGELVVKKLILDNETEEVKLPGVETIPSPTKSDGSPNEDDTDEAKPKDSFFLTAAGEEIEMAEGQALEMESVKTNRYFAESLFMGSLSRDYKPSKMPAKKSLKRPHENASRGRGRYTGYNQTSNRGQMSKSQGNPRHNAYKKDAVEKKEVLHPSWEASKKRKQQETEIKAFAGKKTTFDD